MVSVIIPVYNVEKYLCQCLDSVLAQTFSNLEIITVDDGSTDNSATICDEYADRDSRIRVIHKANGGLSSARNAGLDIATGQWIFFLDSDDYIGPDCIKLLLDTAIATNAGIATCSYTHNPNTVAGNGKVKLLTNKVAINRTLHQTHGMINSACVKLFRREIFDTERFTEGQWYEDLDSFYRFYAKSETIAVVNSPQYYYRLHTGSFLGHWSPERLHVLDVMVTMRQWIAQQMPELLPAVNDREFAAACNMFLLMSREAPTNPALDRCWALIGKHRTNVLFGRGIRPKNRIGALVSFLGRNFFSKLI